MRERWLPVGLLAGSLFLINVASRILVKIWIKGNDDKQVNLGLLALVLIGVLMIGAGVRWVRRYPTPRAWGDLLAAIGAACFACVVLGPLVVGDLPLHDGPGMFFRQIWLFLGMTLGGAGFGALIVMTLGQDWKSQAWKRYSQQAGAKPRKVVRR